MEEKKHIETITIRIHKETADKLRSLKLGGFDRTIRKILVKNEDIRNSTLEKLKGHDEQIYQLQEVIQRIVNFNHLKN